MIKKTVKLTLVMFLSSFLVLSAQNKTPNKILSEVYNTTKKVKDYSVKANIKVDLPFINVKPMDVDIFYKQKDKFKVVSKGIAIVPRQGFDQISKLLSDTNLFSSIKQGEMLVNAVNASIINIIPLSDTEDLIIAKLWIDEKRSLVLRSQLTTKTNGTILTEYTYGTMQSFGLPDAMIFTVDVKKFKIPKGLAGELSNTKQEKNIEKNKGKIFITLKDYKVNKGIPDSLFIK